MTQSEYEAELHFRLCKSIYATLTIRGIIAEDDMHTLLRAAAEKYHTYYFPKFLSALIPNGILIANVVISEIGWVSSKPISPK